MPAREPTGSDATAVPAPARPPLPGSVEGDARQRAFAPLGLPVAGGPLGRIPAQVVSRRAERAARPGQASAHD